MAPVTARVVPAAAVTAMAMTLFPSALSLEKRSSAPMLNAIIPRAVMEIFSSITVR